MAPRCRDITISAIFLKLRFYVYPNIFQKYASAMSRHQKFRDFLRIFFMDYNFIFIRPSPKFVPPRCSDIIISAIFCGSYVNFYFIYIQPSSKFMLPRCRDIEISAIFVNFYFIFIQLSSKCMPPRCRDIKNSAIFHGNFL